MSQTTEQRAGLVGLTPRQWDASLSAPPVLSSDVDWDSALLRQWSNTAPVMVQPVLDHHYVTLHVGGAKRVNRRGEGPAVSADVAAGCLSIMPAGSAFTWRTEGPIGFVHLYVAPRLLDRVVTEELDRDARNVSLIDRVGFEDPLLRDLLRSMLDEIRDSRVASSLLLDSMLRTFTLKLMRDHSTVKAHPVAVGYALSPHRLRRVLAYIEAHLLEEISLNALASVAGSSPYHFSRGFRLATGSPPYRYVVEQRIERAKGLLRKSSLPLVDVAYKCGFNSQRQFGTMFAKTAGISPGRFRRER